VALSKQWLAVSKRWNIFDVSVDEHLKKTAQDALPQANLLKGSVQRLSDKIQEAYLRGSFSMGEADEKSDIDLFVVVEPNHIQTVFDDFVSFIEDKYDILVHCHDRLVKDYGGIGFMFVLKDDQDNLMQFDLYMAMKGVPPKEFLRDCPRIYTSDPNYCWLSESSLQDPPTAANDFISKFTVSNDVKDEIEYQMVDLMVTLNVMKKHLERGQYTRAVNDDGHALSICVEMMRALVGDKSVHSAFYAADGLLNKYADHEQLKDFRPLFYDNVFGAIDYNKIESLYNFGKSFVEKIGGDDLNEKLKPAFEEYERLVINPIQGKQVPVENIISPKQQPKAIGKKNSAAPK
jgi:predicted nucleotidyltransferase